MLTLNNLIKGMLNIQKEFNVETNISGNGDGTISLEVTEMNYTIKPGRLINLN